MHKVTVIINQRGEHIQRGNRMFNKGEGRIKGASIMMDTRTTQQKVVITSNPKGTREEIDAAETRRELCTWERQP